MSNPFGLLGLSTKHSYIVFNIFLLISDCLLILDVVFTLYC